MYGLVKLDLIKYILILFNWGGGEWVVEMRVVKLWSPAS